MNILLTNDDGINSAGIEFLEKKLSSMGHDLYVVAPHFHMSGMSSSVSIGKPVKFDKISDKKYSIEGTPVDCVSFGISYFSDIKFDLVVSGVNHGHNVSYDTVYSGTLGACQQALIFKIPAIAFSIEDNLEGLDANFVRIWEFVLDKYKLNPEFLMNVNYPIGKEMEDIRISTLYYRNDNAILKRVGEDVIYFDRTLDRDYIEGDNDWYLVNHHIVSVTPLIKGYFCLETYKRIKGE